MDKERFVGTSVITDRGSRSVGTVAVLTGVSEISALDLPPSYLVHWNHWGTGGVSNPCTP